MENQYLDDLGVFNKQRQSILELLYKNGVFVENSEVDKIFSKKKDYNEQKNKKKEDEGKEEI